MLKIFTDFLFDKELENKEFSAQTFCNYWRGFGSDKEAVDIQTNADGLSTGVCVCVSGDLWDRQVNRIKKPEVV